MVTGTSSKDGHGTYAAECMGQLGMTQSPCGGRGLMDLKKKMLEAMCPSLARRCSATRKNRANVKDVQGKKKLP